MTPEPTPSQELREKIDKLLDFFTEPNQGEKYLKDLANDLEQLFKQHELSRKQEWARENEPKIEIKAKLEALDKLVLGAGEYHDDPYEYVVRLRDIQRYRQALNKFDLTQPVFKDKTIKEQSKE